MFENFKAVGIPKLEEAKPQDEASIFLEGQRKRIEEAKDSWKVYQICNTCGLTSHSVIGDTVTCIKCGRNYQLVSKDKCNLEK